MNSSTMNIDNCTLATCPVSISKIGYITNVPGNTFFAGWFALMLLLQLILSIRYRTLTYLVGQLIGLVLEIIGYVARIKLHDNPFNNGAFIVYIITITVAPAFLSYTIYLCFGRFVVVYGSELSIIPFRAYTAIFVTMDILCLVLQAAGAGLSQANNITPSQLSHAINILRAGLGLQVASLAIFVLLSIDFGIRLIRKRSLWSRKYESVRDKTSFKVLQLGTFSAAFLILIRCAYRVQELNKGFSSPEAGAQTLFMIFEGAMIGAASLLLVLIHPGPVFGKAWGMTSFFSKQATRDSGIPGDGDNTFELAPGEKPDDARRSV